MSRVVPRIVERHADEAAFLWELRERAAQSPLFDLRSLRALDERLAANLDGLVLAEGEGLRIARAALDRAMGWTERSTGELFAAAHVAAALGDTLAFSRLLVVGQRYPRHERALVSALEWLRARSSLRILSELLADECPAVLHRLGISTREARREDPGAALALAIRSTDRELRAVACRAAGQLGRRDLLPELRATASALNDAVRGWGAWAATRLGDRDAIDILWAAAATPGTHGEAFADLAARCDDASAAAEQLRALAGSEPTLPAALAGAAARGDPACIPWALEVMERRSDLARRAAWVYATITGAKIAPPLFVRGRAHEPGEMGLLQRAREPYDDLPAPAASVIRAHWASVRSDFRDGARYLGGRPLDRTWLHERLREAPQPWRAFAAIEIGLTTTAASLFPVSAPAQMQAAALRAAPHEAYHRLSRDDVASSGERRGAS